MSETAKPPYSNNTNWPCYKMPEGEFGYPKCDLETCPDHECQFREWLENNIPPAQKGKME